MCLEPFLERVSDNVQREDGKHKREARIGGEMRRNKEKLPAIIQHGTPRGRRRFDAEAEKAQASFRDDRRR